jgi:hypothetical protein
VKEKRFLEAIQSRIKIVFGKVPFGSFLFSLHRSNDEIISHEADYFLECCQLRICVNESLPLDCIQTLRLRRADAEKHREANFLFHQRVEEHFQYQVPVISY